MAEAPIVRIVLPRGTSDCAVAALAMIVGCSYEDAFAAAVRIDPRSVANGLCFSHFIRAAKLLGTNLKRRRKFDLETDTGVLRLWLEPTKSWHSVMVVPGYIIDDGMLWEPEVYFRHYGGTPEVLLTVG